MGCIRHLNQTGSTSPHTTPLPAMSLPKHPLHVSDLPSAVLSWILRRLRRGGIPNAKSEANGGQLEKNGVGHPGGRDVGEDERDETSDLHRQLELERATSEQRRVELEASLTEGRQLQLRLTQLESSAQEASQLRRQVEQETSARLRSEEQVRAADADARQLRGRLAQLEGEARHSAGKIAELERVHAQVEKERRSATALLQARTAELREAQSFLPPTKEGDAIEDGEVVHIVEALNAQIARTADRIASGAHLRFGSSGGADASTDTDMDTDTDTDTPIVQKAVRRLERYAWIPPCLISTLRSESRSNSLSSDMVRTSLQAGMATYTRWLAASWDLGVLDSRGLLEGIYMSIRGREPQSIAGRWRALCRTHVKSLLETGEGQTQRLFETLSIIVADVLIVCGAAGTWDSVSEVVVREFETELYEIVNLALKFQWTVGECVVSRDFVICVADSDAPYDPTRMENGRAVDVPSALTPNARVLCTTHLGLMSETKIGGRGEEAKTRTTILTKAKVVLRTHQKAVLNGDV